MSKYDPYPEIMACTIHLGAAFQKMDRKFWNSKCRRKQKQSNRNIYSFHVSKLPIFLRGEGGVQPFFSQGVAAIPGLSHRSSNKERCSLQAIAMDIKLSAGTTSFSQPRNGFTFYISTRICRCDIADGRDMIIWLCQSLLVMTRFQLDVFFCEALDAGLLLCWNR